MDNSDSKNQQNIPSTADNIGGQNFPPSNYPYIDPAREWQMQQGQQATGYPAQYPQQGQFQPTVPSPSPEVPTRSESGESLVGVEAVPEQEKPKERQDRGKEDQAKGEQISASEQVPSKKRFESPFRFSGYKASQKIIDLGKKSAGKKVRGDTSLAQTWLIVLLGRLLRMH